ncbi:MAG: restriction endonuclease subunit S [Pirellulaceae bacterium]|nr:restriction endonuclease subunit S [Pirellulaceae bacterium]
MEVTNLVTAFELAEWQTCRLTALASRSANAIVGGPFGSDLTSADYRSTGIPVIRGQNMGTRFVSGDFVYVDRSKGKKLQANLAKPGDLVFTQRGTLGQVSIVPNCGYPEFLISQSQMKISLACEFVDVNYLYQYFTSSFGQKQIFESAIQTGVPHTNLGILRSYVVRLPPNLAEQEAIAGALSDADAWIDSLEQLIAKKRQIKQGAMQELLTGKRRLPGYSSKWTKELLGECGEVIMGQSPPGSTYNRSADGSPLINGPTEFTDRYPKKIQWTRAPARFCKSGDLLICVRGSSTGRTNFADDVYAIGRGVAAIRAKGSNSTDFMSHQVIAGVSEILASATGSTFPSVDGASFRKISIQLPNPDEQEAIAFVLSAIESEVTELEFKLFKGRQIKQAMMQELLTGRIRLVKSMTTAVRMQEAVHA